MGVVYFSIIPTFEPSRYCKCWIVCFYYKKSQYLWISKFVEKYGEWNDDMIDERAKNLAAAYYGGILEKKLPSDVNIGEYI